MILMSDRGGGTFAVNPDLIARVDGSPHAVIHLVDGTQHRAAESVTSVVDKVVEYRAQLMARSLDLREQPGPRPGPARPTLVPLPD